MLNSRYVLTFFWGLSFVLTILNSNVEAERSPVLLWRRNDDAATINPVNPFEETSQTDFGEIVSKNLGGTHDRPILVFRTDSFCVEDLTQHKGAFHDLKEDYTLTYVPMVDSPLSVFKNLPSYNESLEELPEIISTGEVMIIKVTDLNTIVGIFKKAEETNPDVVGALTSPGCSLMRTRRTRRAVDETVSETNSNGTIVVTPRVLLYYLTPPTLVVTQEKSTAYELLEVKQQGGDAPKSPLELHFVYSVPNATTSANASVVLAINEDGSSYWNVKAYYLEKDDKRVRLATQSYFVFPRVNSYHCSGKIRFYQKHKPEKTEVQPGIDFTMGNFQMQIDAKKSNFDYPFDCVGFTSVPIWSGLFVTIILGIIMIWGLIMIMDIRTMDRFDDPKGKTITITASE